MRGTNVKDGRTGKQSVRFAVRSRGRDFRMTLLLAAVLLGSSSIAAGQSEFTLQTSPALSALNMPAALTNQLDPQGSRVLRTNGTGTNPVCDVWWVKPVLAKKPAATQSRVLYGDLEAGAVVGLLRFITLEAEDSLDQKLKPGFYTMRYVQVPPGSDEADKAEYRDFLLLTPVAADLNVTKALSFEEASRMSAKAAGTEHPVLMSLVPANPAYKTLPAVVADDLGNCALQAKLHDARGSEYVLSLLLVTPPKEEGGS